MTNTNPAAKRRAELAAEFTPEQIAGVTRGLSVADFARAFNAGWNSLYRNIDTDLDARLGRYLNRSPKTPAQEGAWLDGNTWGDLHAEEFIRERINGEI